MTRQNTYINGWFDWIPTAWDTASTWVTDTGAWVGNLPSDVGAIFNDTPTTASNIGGDAVSASILNNNIGTAISATGNSTTGLWDTVTNSVGPTIANAQALNLPLTTNAMNIGTSTTSNFLDTLSTGIKDIGQWLSNSSSNKKASAVSNKSSLSSSSLPSSLLSSNQNLFLIGGAIIGVLILLQVISKKGKR